MILNEPVQLRFQVEFLSVSVCAGVTHLFIYFESNCKLVLKMKSILCQPKGDLNPAVFMQVT